MDRALGRLEEGARGACVAVVGEPGIGKTRLLGELGARALANGSTVVAGRASEFEREAPFGPFVDALDRHLADLDPRRLRRVSPDHWAELTGVFPALAGYTEPSDTQASGTVRFRLHHAVQATLGELAADRPLLLVLDDLQWADDASLELISHLLRRPPEGRVLLALAYRSGRVPRSLSGAVTRGQREGLAERLELGPLTSGEADELLGGAVDPALRRSLRREAGGNPFYLEQLMRGARTGGGMRALAPEPTSGRVPRPVVAAIEDEVAALADPARALLEAAAVVGDPFDLDLAVSVAGAAEREAVTAADALLAAGLVRVDDVPGRYAFRHPIVRHAVYESVGAAWRLAAHKRIARVLAERGSPASARAHHVASSARKGDEEAVALLREAAATTARPAPATAARWYRAALRLLPPDADPPHRLELLLPLASALNAAGRIELSREVLEEAVELVPLERPRDRVRVLVNIVRADHMVGRHGRELLERALAEHTDAHTVALLRFELALEHWQDHDWDGMVASVIAAREQARAVGDRALEAEALALLALAEHFGGDLGRVATHLEEGERLIAAVSDDELGHRLEPFAWLAYGNQLLERREQAIAHLKRAITIGRASNQDYFLVQLTASLGVAELWLGRIAQAARRAEVALDAAQPLGNPPHRLLALTLRALAAHAQGERQVAEEATAEGVRIALRRPNMLHTTLHHAVAGLIRIESGDVAGGRDTIVNQTGGVALRELGAGLRPRFLAALAFGELELGRVEAAEAWVSRAEGLAAELGLAGSEGTAAWARAGLLLARGEDLAAAELASVAAERLRSVPMPVEAARAEVVAAQALAAADDRERALATLEAAHTALTRCGADRYRAHAERELRRLGRRIPSGGRPKATSTTGTNALSRREREVAELVAQGLSNREVADQLFLSTKTIESHLSRAFRKLEISSRSALARALERPREP